ncbi:MAG: membrane protein insertion efficiency factor YidD [Desulfobacterales bacterium]|nr:membrane protein insertion efficiency factor YidD [Desulfobacterales bacterium]
MTVPERNFQSSCGEATIRKLVLIVIRAYQAAISPYLGRNCRFYPTCSEYSYQAICKFGVLHGCYLSVKRIARCHPFHRGGYDPLP